MDAHDVMTSPVVTVSPSMPVREMARLMVDRRIGGILVAEPDGAVVGIVTDGDLYRRAELGTEGHGGGFLASLIGDGADARSFVGAHGRTARDVMTPDVIAVAPDTTLNQIAELFETRKIHLVPVMHDGGLVGIVSRADLVRALASMPDATHQHVLDDKRIRDMVIAEYRRSPWGLKSEKSVIVSDGVVHLWGYVPSEDEQRALRITAEEIPGVKSVEDHTISFLGDAGVRPRVTSSITVIKRQPS
jgi:CBS domain-containing protein